MSYHVYGQADWFYGGKPPADAPVYGDPSGQKLAPVPPAGGKKAPPPKPKMAPSPAPAATYYEEEEGGGLLLYAGIGAAVLAIVLIYVKFIRGGSDEAVAAAPKPKKAKPKIKLEIAMDDEEDEG